VDFRLGVQRKAERFAESLYSYRLDIQPVVDNFTLRSTMIATKKSPEDRHPRGFRLWANSQMA
jgi:hypothetical protein